jgi:hypothetical protein
LGRRTRSKLADVVGGAGVDQEKKDVEDVEVEERKGDVNGIGNGIGGRNSQMQNAKMKVRAKNWRYRWRWNSKSP